MTPPARWYLTMLTCLLAATLPLSARNVGRRVTPNTGTPRLDSLLLQLNDRVVEEERKGVGQLDLNVYVKSWSQVTQRKRLCRIIPNLLPFETSQREAASEALCLVSFQAPCNLQITPVAERANSRKGRKLLRKVFPVLLPTYALSQRKNDRYYVFPFTDDGLAEYDYNLTETTDSLTGDSIYIISFTPFRPHRVLMSGSIAVNAQTGLPIQLQANGRIDFGTFSMTMFFGDFESQRVPSRSHIVIDYNYLNNRGRNTYDCIYTFHSLMSREELHQARRKAKAENHGYSHYDLTGIYDRIFPKLECNWDSLRPEPLTPDELRRFSPGDYRLPELTDSATDTVRTPNVDSVTTAMNTDTVSLQPIQLHHNQLKTSQKRALYQSIPERLMTSSNVNAFGTDLKVSGPLDPASISYDKLNGVSFRERLRWSYCFNDGRNIIVRPEIGYSFGLKELRYNLTAEWIYWPERRCGLQLTARNRNSGFSSLFSDLVNNALAADTLKTDFNSLGINYYHHYETRLEQSYELANGLMAFVGVLYNYRTPVKHGTWALPEDKIDAVVKDSYMDLSPYVRIEWQGHQYYHYRNRQKLYIASIYPKFGIEWAQSIGGIHRDSGKFGRVELDVEQDIQLTPNRSLSYHSSVGMLYRQQGEYFVNYRYFAANQYPESWNDHIGGVFHLLTDHWYLSSSAYLQSHVMYESPFLLLHHMKSLSKYAIKERIYVSSLLAKGKSYYTEAGYGMGNNYFNVGGFIGFSGKEFMGVGVRTTIEIEQHW